MMVEGIHLDKVIQGINFFFVFEGLTFAVR